MVTPKPMVLVTIYPDGWVETRATDDVRVKIHTVPPLRGNGSEVDAEHGISFAALRQAYKGLPMDWRRLVDETDARGIQTGMPNAMPEAERYKNVWPWMVLDTFITAVKEDDHLRLELHNIEIPDWMKDHAEKVRAGKVGKRWREMYRDQKEGV